MKHKIVVVQAILIVVCLSASYKLTMNNRMSDNWMAPYLSSAENLNWSGSFKINLEEVLHFKSLNEAQQDAYKFSAQDDLITYNHNPIGYSYLIKFSKIIFPFLGDQMAIMVLQGLVFLLINLLFLSMDGFSNKQRWIFFFLFAVNPIVLRFVSFNFYYFWQLIPSAIFGYLLLAKKPKTSRVMGLLVLLPFVFLTRPTVLFALLVVFYFLFKKIERIPSIIATLYFLLIVLWLYQPAKKNIWHTVYTGVGAYENSFDVSLNDNNTYRLYEEATGVELNPSVGGNYYDNDVIEAYTEITKRKTLEIFNESPLLFVKNALLNTLQGYSIGYLNKKGDLLNYLSAFAGFVFILLLLRFKKYSWFLMIGLTVGTFTLYYPPIQGYMYGAFLLAILAFVAIFNDMFSPKPISTA